MLGFPTYEFKKDRFLPAFSLQVDTVRFFDNLEISFGKKVCVLCDSRLKEGRSGQGEKATGI